MICSLHSRLTPTCSTLSSCSSPPTLLFTHSCSLLGAPLHSVILKNQLYFDLKLSCTVCSLSLNMLSILLTGYGVATAADTSRVTLPPLQLPGDYGPLAGQHFSSFHNVQLQHSPAQQVMLSPIGQQQLVSPNQHGSDMSSPMSLTQQSSPVIQSCVLSSPQSVHDYNSMYSASQLQGDPTIMFSGGAPQDGSVDLGWQGSSQQLDPRLKSTTTFPDPWMRAANPQPMLRHHQHNQNDLGGPSAPKSARMDEGFKSSNYGSSSVTEQHSIPSSGASTDMERCTRSVDSSSSIQSRRLNTEQSLK